ncbi:hypothetical protein CYMTET_9650 [Cymbomonas tetramitiformis]|uniref:Uncharacterized protein n=1 Tax=Cymbomonas tetramitiformis TaxID=36881 RepID=A0AAE0GR27_9CHLO|nr:hypothetical protein CYMTET_44106 [Cymbomonas tetramitiformis]KAK3282628.1 hypothetical protein CYMTET_9650 [Cymbomonas tetramitiformis]
MAECKGYILKSQKLKRKSAFQRLKVFLQQAEGASKLGPDLRQQLVKVLRSLVQDEREAAEVDAVISIPSHHESTEDAPKSNDLPSDVIKATKLTSEVKSVSVTPRQDGGGAAEAEQQPDEGEKKKKKNKKDKKKEKKKEKKEVRNAKRQPN